MNDIFNSELNSKARVVKICKKAQARCTHRIFLVHTTETVVDLTICLIVGPTAECSWINSRVQLAQLLAILLAQLREHS